jgi:hypothetical protein
MSFDYKKFKNSIIKQYTNILDEVIISEILDLGDENDYIRDTPISTGKRLIREHVTFLG